ncbi:MAG: hypothetical protein PHW11_01930 [Anaerolineaceae bacterium]|jgi:hypothetical protein|nr:hypothetical protein [Anaerolineaceae bacterium]MDD4041989.1 hypothetical protein [Anaerolineaceae bacterium]MDD4577454.1 hypothetical protein [Anaerolineaceae bacterium]
MSELQPLYVINVFIEAWFRQEIIENVLTDFSVYSDEVRKNLAETLKTEVKVSGFRNPLTAPKRLLVRESEKLFETDPYFVKAILDAWVQLYDKHSPTFDKALKTLGFMVSPIAPAYENPVNAFEQGWPDGVDYPKVIEAVRKEDAKLEMTDDQIVLYSILQTGYLPGEHEE